MKCPKCGKNMSHDAHNNFCLFCGYLGDGKFISKNEKLQQCSDVEIYLGKRYDNVLHNETNVLIFFLGPLYFCYRKHLILGLLFFFLDVLVYYLVLIFSKDPIILLFTFLFLRVIYMTGANTLYLKLCNIKVKNIKSKFGNNYLDELRKRSDNTCSILYIFLSISIVLSFFFIMFLIKKN